MKTKFTPGPWNVQDNTDLDGLGHQLRVDSCAGAIAEIGRKPYVDDESRANARLIAAAPDLLDALKMAVAHIPKPTMQDRDAAMRMATLAHFSDLIERIEGEEK